nr:hypothetical protein BaRGS_007641 [Batillaria attramentaria]
MLRLGKRASLRRLQDKQDELKQQRPGEGESLAITPEQLRAVLEALLDETRDRERPAGIRRCQDTDANLSSTLTLALTSTRPSARTAGPTTPHRFSQLALQAGRPEYKAQTFLTRRHGLVRAWEQQEPGCSLAKDRSYLGRLYKFRPAKAVPAPRIGRQDDPDLAKDEQLTEKRSPSQFSVDSEQKAVGSATEN